MICAAKKKDAENFEDYLNRDIRDALRAQGYTWDNLPFGCAVCVARLVACIPTRAIPQNERQFGNFQPNRYAWKLENVRLFDQPIPARGAQGLWEWTGPLPTMEGGEAI